MGRLTFGVGVVLFWFNAGYVLTRTTQPLSRESHLGRMTLRYRNARSARKPLQSRLSRRNLIQPAQL